MFCLGMAYLSQSYFCDMRICLKSHDIILRKFLNLEPIVGLDKIISLTNFASLSRQEAANGFKEAVNGATFFKQGTSRQWEGLDHALLNEITETFGPAMGVFGYD